MKTKALHINASKGAFASTVLMPGDPLRAKYMADKFLTKVKLVTNVRNVLGYTGFYNGKKVSIMASGMGMSSISIYIYELVKYYNVKEIIRIGTCGALTEDIEIPQIILASDAFSESNFAYTYANDNGHLNYPDQKLNNKIIATAKDLNIDLKVGTFLTTEVFGPYVDRQSYMKRIPKDIHPIVEEMEAYALLLIGKVMKVKTACLVTCTDSEFSKKALTPKERQTSLDSMIVLALETITK